MTICCGTSEKRLLDVKYFQLYCPNSTHHIQIWYLGLKGENTNKCHYDSVEMKRFCQSERVLLPLNTLEAGLRAFFERRTVTSSTHHFPSCWDINWWWSGGDKLKSAHRASGENRTVRAPAPRSDWFDRWKLLSHLQEEEEEAPLTFLHLTSRWGFFLLDESEAEVLLCSSTIQQEIFPVSEFSYLFDVPVQFLQEFCRLQKQEFGWRASSKFL